MPKQHTLRPSPPHQAFTSCPFWFRLHFLFVGGMAASSLRAFSMLNSVVAGRDLAVEPAMKYYNAALRGAAAGVTPGSESPQLRNLARLHLRAVKLRRKSEFGRASALYHSALSVYSSGALPRTTDVPKAAAAACTYLNLALTLQSLGNMESARRTFKDGVKYVHDFLKHDSNAWIDREGNIRAKGDVSDAEKESLKQAFLWLATLLTAWALLETKRGRTFAARGLAAFAAFLDVKKAPLLDWKLMCRR